MDHPTIATETILSKARMLYQMIYWASTFFFFLKPTRRSGLEKKAENFV